MDGVVFVKLISIIFVLIGTFGAYFLIPLLKSRLSAEELENIAFWVSVAVNAAEQIFTGSGQGEDKKQHVINFLNSKAIRITKEQLDMLIEAAVFEMNQLKLMKG